jgi:hypothetical protein
MSAMLAPDEILRLRLANQRLTLPISDPAEVVAHLGAVQSQDYPAARWALGLRVRNLHVDAVEAAFAEGRLLRTHVLRPTWHFVAPHDIRWMLALTAPRIRASMATYTRSLGLDERVLAAASDVIALALRGSKSLMRGELGGVLRDAGVAAAADSATLGLIMSHAELDGVVCSGPRRGNQHTYALLEERAPAVPMLDHDAAVAELTWRYFNSHGPALVRDCGWWSGLTVSEINRGLEANATRLQNCVVDGRTYWFSALAPTGGAPELSSAYLLPNYDEYTVAYRERDLYYDRAANAVGDPRQDVPFRNVLLVDGQVMGRWTATPRGDVVNIELRWSFAPTPCQREAIEVAAAQYASFQGMECRVENSEVRTQKSADF